ncbi:hypothetical protein ACHMW6_06235 [Pseudoduganella sp. UC29_106]|uniref:hypothetical protein n=1 Tax=Pseudoduganella sp. UC29_106 TaxID=3374553 RepID=UPI003757E76C
MTARSVLSLDQLQRTIRLANVLKVVSGIAFRAREKATLVIDRWFAVGKLQFHTAAYTFPHGRLLGEKGIVA